MRFTVIYLSTAILEMEHDDCGQTQHFFRFMARFYAWLWHRKTTRAMIHYTKIEEIV